ncbi:MAG: glycosyltransferase family 2 protein [Thermoguttaceae bacterium]
MERFLSALLPVRNVESTLAATIGEMLEVLSELTPRFEVVVVDDCSYDATIEVADELLVVTPQLQVVRHAQPLGRPAMVRTAIGASRGEVLFLQDEQCSLGFAGLRKLWLALRQRDLAVAVSALGATPKDQVEVPRPAGCCMGTRRVFDEIGESIGDLQCVSYYATLQWGKEAIFEIPNRRPSVGSHHRVADQARRLFHSPSDRECLPDGLDPAGMPQSIVSRPKRPNYLARLKELSPGK